jgi:hypothetical protein
LCASAVYSRRSSAARADVTPADFPNNGGRQNDSIDLSVAMSVDVPLNADGKSASLAF